MIGREHELGVVCDLLQRPEVAILTLTGPGGIGKTRLALEAAFSLAESFPDQVAGVSLAAISDPGLVMSAVGRALGLPEDLGQPAVESVKAHLHGKSALIVLDSFEQVAEAAIDVAELLTSCPRLKLLITSRRPLHLSDEYEFPVPSLTVPDATRPALVYELARCPSVALFVERAAAVRPGFGLTELNARSVASICARLDGLPLAIELAATRIRFLTPEAMLARLERSLPMLEGGAADMPARHRTLRATTAWSYELLTDEEKRLFRHCSVFVGGFSLEAVERVCSQDGQSGLGVLGGLASLVDQSLILQEEHTSGDPRFTELQTIREFALEQLEHSNEAMALRQAHAAYFLSLIQESELMLLAASDEDCLNRVEREHDNFRAVLQYALETGDTEPGLLLAGTLRPFWQIRGHMREGMDWLTRLLACSSPERRTIGRAKALNAAGFASVMLGDYERALQLGRESLSIYRELEQPQGIIEALHHLGLAQRCIGRFDDSRDTFEEALAATRNIGQHLWEGRVLHGYARTAFNAGDPNRSRQLLEQALDCKPEVEDTLARAMVLTDLADVTRGTGDHPASMEALREAFEIWQRLGHVRGVAQCLEALAFLLSDRSDAASVAELIVRLLASASAIRVRIADPSSPYRRGEIGRVLEGTRQSVSTAAFDESWQRGQQADPDGLFTEAFEQLMTLAAAYAG